MATGTAATAELVAQLAAVVTGGAVVDDVRNAHPPCVLVPPPERLYDVTVGWSATWRVLLLAPGEGGNADTAAVLDDLADEVEAAVELDLVEVLPSATVLRAGEPPVPCYIATITRAV